MPLGLIAAASVTDAAIQTNVFGTGVTALTISNEEINDIMKIIKSLQKFGLLVKGLSKTIKNEAKEQKDGFLGMLLGTLSASLLENLLTGKGVIRVGEWAIATSRGKGAIRAGHDF